MFTVTIKTDDDDGERITVSRELLAFAATDAIEGFVVAYGVFSVYELLATVITQCDLACGWNDTSGESGPREKEIAELIEKMRSSASDVVLAIDKYIGK